VGERGLFQSGRRDQVGFVGVQDTDRDRAGEHEVRVIPRLDRCDRAGRTGGDLASVRVRRRKILNGLISQYSQAA
jgi:hypothetical protein